MSFKNMKKNSLETLVNRMKEQEKKGGFTPDERLWQPTVDKAGNGFAVIRFLPAVDGEDMPYVVNYQHSFKYGAKWFIENCPSTIGEKCPVCENNSEHWNTGLESEQKIARDRKRNKSYFANILVISDKDHPENEGKVKIFRFGQKIYDKINAVMNPEFEDDTPINPFDFWEGAAFRIKIKNVKGFRNYDDSAFTKQTELFDGDDEKLEELWKLQYPLLPLIAKSEYKSYDELKTKFYSTIGGTVPVPAQPRNNIASDDDFDDIPVRGTSSVRNTTVSTDDFDESDYDALLKEMDE